MISLKLDTTLPRYYSREFTVRGTKGMFEENFYNVHFANDEHEILALTGKETQEEGALALHAITGNIVIVTLGGKGCLCVDKEGKLLYAEGRKVKVMDTIGAGDSHAGTMLGCLYKGMDLVEAMKLANAVASEVVSCEGAQVPRTLDFLED
jgi:sugar/nucleoside kinase (ribokinase family)